MKTLILVLVVSALPQQRGPFGRPPTAAQIELGRKLFFDPRLSDDGTVSCATCHDPKQGWADGKRVAVGVRGQIGNPARNSPTIVNATFQQFMFHDARTSGTTTQSLLPIVNSREMGQQTEQQVMDKVAVLYGAEFVKIFGFVPNQPIVTGAKYSQLIAAFESIIVSGDAPIDRYEAGEEDALSDDAKAGLDVFLAKKCNACHPPPLYTTGGIANNGMSFIRGTMLTNGRVLVPDQGRFAAFQDQQEQQRNRITEADRRKFKVPTLREIQRTAPYGHAGHLDDLERVVAHYASGGAAMMGNPLRALQDQQTDTRVRSIRMTKEESEHLVTFLKEAFAGADYPMMSPPELP